MEKLWKLMDEKTMEKESNGGLEALDTLLKLNN